MLGDQIRTLRKTKGLSQEELAYKVHVVRQTISKWEKNQSVPDADMLEKLSDVLEVSVSELLGADIKQEPVRNEIAEQLSKLNEQLVIRNRRAGMIWKIVGIILLAGILITAVCTCLFTVRPSDRRNNVTYTTELIGTVTDVQDKFIIVSAPEPDSDDETNLQEYKVFYKDMNSSSIQPLDAASFKKEAGVHIWFGGLPGKDNILSGIDDIEILD